MTLRVFFAVLVLVCSTSVTRTHAQIPPRFYWKTLSGSHAVPVIGLVSNGNANPIDPARTILAGADFEATVALAGYAHTFALFDRSALVALLLPMGRVSGEATLFGETFDQSASGFGDPLLEFSVNVIGPEALRTIPDLLRYEPGFSLDLLADIAFPIGEYDDDQPLNLGQNRWYGRLAAPIVWQVGDWVPGRRTTVELLPSVWFYGDNTDFVGRKLSTDPMFQLEAHLTRDLIEELWASFDVTWVAGGESTIDGVPGEDLNNVGIGFTLGYHLTKNLQVTAAYMATVNDEDPGDLELDGLRVSLVFGWNALVEGMERLEGTE